MKIIKASYDILDQQPGFGGVLKQIEIVARTCYKSDDKITEDSARGFVERMKKSGHSSTLEHGTIYLSIPVDINHLEESHAARYISNHYSKVGQIVQNTKKGCHAVAYITTNYRVIHENHWEDDLEFLCEPTDYHEKRVTVRFTCDRVTGESFLRHREIDEDHPTIEGEVTRENERDIDSFARESTRYCNYSKEKFGKELTIIVPPEFPENTVETALDTWDCSAGAFREMCAVIATDQDDDEFGIIDTWLFGNLATEWAYFRLLKLGQKPEQARRVLPLDIKSPLVMTAFISDWKHYFDLRCDCHAHSQARELAIPLHEEFIERGFL